MSKLLDQAIAKARELPDDVQDAMADALFAHIVGEDEGYQLSPEQMDDVKRIQQELRNDKTRLATDEEAAAVWTKCGL
jgi:hypothetical protein